MKGCVSREGTRRGGRTENAGAVPGARQGTQSCPSALGGKILGSGSSSAKPQVRQERKTHNGVSWPLWPSTFASQPHLKHFYVCVPSPDFFIFTCQMTPVYLDLSLLKKPESIMISQCLKKEKKTPFPQDVLY